MRQAIEFAINPGDPQAMALRAGSRDFNGPRQIFKPAPILLAKNIGSEASPLSLKVQVPAPDSRCRIKISVLFVPKAGLQIVDYTGWGSIWIAACDEEQGAVAGGGGRVLPVTALEGTQDEPTSFPESDGLSGYSREFVTAADWLHVNVTINEGDDSGGYWVLQTRIQPDAVTLDWGEWDEIRRLFLPTRIA
jgi:hypothetical protein